MILSVRTYKIRKVDECPVYKTYRYACFDTDSELEDKTFEEKFNYAFDVLKEEIQQDSDINNVNAYGNIEIASVYLS